MTLPDRIDLEKIHAYLDDLLGPEDRSAFEARLLAEPSLAAALENERRFRVGLRARLRQAHVPRSLRTDIQATLARSEAKSPWSRLTGWLSTPLAIQPYAAIAYTLLLFVIFSGLVWWFNQPFSFDDHAVFRQFAGKHAVYLEIAPTLDVRGEPADIAAWFEQRVPFPVSIPTLADWTLEGGRLGEFHHQGIAHLVYDQAGQHISLTLFVPRETDFPADARQQINDTEFFVGGDDQHTVILWRIGDVGYALVGESSLTTDKLLAIAISLKSQLD
jgi:anti-sigma factor RsiW